MDKLSTICGWVDYDKPLAAIINKDITEVAGSRVAIRCGDCNRNFFHARLNEQQVISIETKSWLGMIGSRGVVMNFYTVAGFIFVGYAGQTC